MKKETDDIINESSINDLIEYSEENSDIPEEENDISEGITAEEPAEKPVEKSEKKISEEKIEETDNSLSYGEDYDEDYDEEYQEDYYEDDEFFDFLDEEKPSKGHKGIIIGIIIGVLAVLIFIGIDTGLLEKYKNNFVNNFSSLFPSSSSTEEIPVITPRPEAEYNTQIEKNTIVSFDSASKTKFLPYNDGIICANMNHITFVDNDGNISWEKNTAIVSPILKAENDYILLAENGGKKICLYENDKLLYDVDDADSIVAAELSSDGDVIVITNKSSYKGGISVYNKSGAQIFSWASGSDTIMCADISSSARRVAVALLNTDNNAKTTVQLFNINEKESYSKTDIENTVVFDMRFTDDIVNVFGDNRVVGISEKGKIIYNNLFDTVQLTHSAIDEDGNKILSFEDGNMPMVSLYDDEGDFQKTFALNGVTDFVDIKNNRLLYNVGRNIYFGEEDDKNLTKYTATMDIKNMFIISDNSFVIIYSNSFEIVTI